MTARFQSVAVLLAAGLIASVAIAQPPGDLFVAPISAISPADWLETPESALNPERHAATASATAAAYRRQLDMLLREQQLSANSALANSALPNTALAKPVPANADPANSRAKPSAPVAYRPDEEIVLAPAGFVTGTQSAAPSQAAPSQAAPTQASASPEKKRSTAADDGWQDVSQEKWTVKLGGHVQLDYVNWAQAAPSIPNTHDYVEFRRLRLVADGTGYGLFDFRLQMTLEPESVGESVPGTVTSPEVKDAYLSMNEIPGFGRMRIGNFFVPFGLEQVTNDTNNVFLERSIPTQGVFTPDREVGIAFYNSTESRRLTWCYGAFFDSVSEALKERIDDNQGYRVSGRLTWLPVYDEASNGRYLVHTGVGVLHTGDQDERVRFRARPQIREGARIIDSGVLAAEQYTTGNLELAIVYGAVTFQSEAYLSNAPLIAGGSVTAAGMYAHLSYFLTGENRIFEPFGQHGAQFGRNVPTSNLFATRNGVSFGAWELKARWSTLDLSDANRGQYNDLTAGVNWYWSDRTRVMFDWIHPITSSEAVYGRTHPDLLGVRFDFNW